ncbi:MAG: SAM-dependent chlorinase/fluorinase [Verrucomicrobia subdivision 3 bacterium]|nr:SAM-dependent chlorinase/fluorinase [Limisphaerales bacterium]
MNSPLITLTTDFGEEDWFVGTMKGVILGINSGVRIVDITHQVPRGDMRAGAYALMASYRFFPLGTIHLAVVDPGVGSERRAIAALTPNGIFVGPDNGVLSWALHQETILEVRQLENMKWCKCPVSRTFHGRDIFAPMAAYLSLGKGFLNVGRKLRRIERLPWPQPARTKKGWRGEVLYIDRYGNCMTNLTATMAEETGGGSVRVARRRVRLGGFYQSVSAGEAVALVSSVGFVEIAINGGSAAQKLGVSVGTAVELRF